MVPPPAPVGPNDEELVEAMLGRWARAYSALDARGVDDLQPGMERTLDKQFAALRTVSLALTGCRVSVQEARASAECGEQFSAETRVGGQRSSVSRRRQFTLEKGAGGWRITSARVVR